MAPHRRQHRGSSLRVKLLYVYHYLKQYGGLGLELVIIYCCCLVRCLNALKYIIWYAIHTSFAFSSMLLQGGNGLALDTSELHLFLELVGVANSGEEMRLSAAVRIKGGEPLVPLFFWRFGLLEITNDRVFNAGKKAVVDNRIITPSIDGSCNIVVGFFLQPGALFQVETWTLDIVELKGIPFKDKANPRSLYPKQGSKENVEGTTRDSNNRWRTVGSSCMNKQRR
jgi:hypothetical protein